MNARQKRKILQLHAKKWSLRDIGAELDISHETVRGVIAAEPAAATKPKTARRRKPKPTPTAGSLLDVARALLAELRRRARQTNHPTLGPRFASDATVLAGLVLRLERQAAERTDGVATTLADIGERRARVRTALVESLERASKDGRLVCSDCGCALSATLRNEKAPPLADAKAARVTGTGADGMIAEARETLAWLIASANGSANDGDEIATQRFGRGAVSVAGFVARLEKAIESARTDQIEISSSAIAERRAVVLGRMRAIRERPLLCAACNRKLSVFWGTGELSTEALCVAI
jgi:hypothetical protein